MIRIYKLVLPCIALCLVTGSSRAASTVSLLRFGAAGQGSDDSRIFQRALAATAAARKQLEIPASPRPYHVRPLFLPSNADILVDSGVVVEAVSGYGTFEKLLNIVNVSNVSIRGAKGHSTFRMLKPEYRDGEYRHCLSIEGASNVYISGISCNDSGGDGLYISDGHQPYSSNITVEDSTFDNNRRQGFSLISGRGIFIRRCSFTNTKGTVPADGIDIEPNTGTNYLEDINIEDSATSGNAGNGFAIDARNLHSSSRPVSVSVRRLKSSHNQASGFFATNENTGKDGGTGLIRVIDSESSMDAQYGAVASFYNSAGPAIRFENLTIIDPNQSRSTYDNAAMAVKRGGGGAGQIGNVFFVRPTIVDKQGNLECYLSLRDYSGIGFSRIRLADPLKLAGARSAKDGLLVQGRPVVKVDLP